MFPVEKFGIGRDHCITLQITPCKQRDSLLSEAAKKKVPGLGDLTYFKIHCHDHSQFSDILSKHLVQDS